MSTPAQTPASPERLVDLLDVKTFPPPADFAARAKRLASALKAQGMDTLQTVIVVRSTGAPCDMRDGRDHWYHELLELLEQAEPAARPTASER